MRAHEFLSERTEPFQGLDLEMEFDEDEIWVTARDGSGRELGHVLFVDTGDELVPQDLEVEERFRGQGIARVMYDWVKSKGYRIRRSNQQTQAGAEFWNKYKPGKNVWEHIVESRSADLYHGTSLEAAEQILQSNMLRPGDSSHGDEGNVSLTRDFGVALNAASWQEPAGVILVLDQQRIMHRSRLRPFDWGGGSDEAEEISRKPITGINKIIRKIIVLRHDEFDPEEFPRVLEDPRTQIVDQESVPEYSTARQFDRQQGVAEGIDPDVYDDLDARTIVRAAKRVMPDIQGRDTDEGYVHLTSSRGLDLYIGASVADGEISINIGSGGGLATSGTDQGAVTAIIKAVYDTAVRKYGQPDTPGSLTIDDDAGHGVWQHIAQKLGLTYDSMNENFADGRVKGRSRPGRVKRAGASCKGSVTDLRARAKKYGGEKGKMYHWCANMKSGKKKAK